MSVIEWLGSAWLSFQLIGQACGCFFVLAMSIFVIVVTIDDEEKKKRRYKEKYGV